MNELLRQKIYSDYADLNKENLNTIERSKFICNIKGIQDEEEARQYIEMLRKR